jgi:hypothetical protein
LEIKNWGAGMRPGKIRLDVLTSNYHQIFKGLSLLWWSGFSLILNDISKWNWQKRLWHLKMWCVKKWVPLRKVFKEAGNHLVSIKKWTPWGDFSTTVSHRAVLGAWDVQMNLLNKLEVIQESDEMAR